MNKAHVHGVLGPRTKKALITHGEIGGDKRCFTS